MGEKQGQNPRVCVYVRYEIKLWAGVGEEKSEIGAYSTLRTEAPFPGHEGFTNTVIVLFRDKSHSW